MLVANGDLTEELAVPHDRLEFFATVHNAVGFALPGLDDYATDVFFLLHAVASELAAGRAEITEALTVQEKRQLTTLFAVFQDAFGIPAAAVEAIAVALTGSTTAALELFVAPVLAAADAGETTTRSRRRIRTSARRTAGYAGSPCSSRNCRSPPPRSASRSPTRTSSASSRRR